MTAQPQQCGQIVVAWGFGALLAWVVWRLALSWIRHRRIRGTGRSVYAYTAIALTHDTIAHTRVVIIASFGLALVLALGEHEPYALLAAYIAVARVFRQAVAYDFLDYVAPLDRPTRLHGNLLAADDKFIVVPRHLARRMIPAAILR